MGKAARRVRARTCKECKRAIYADAKEMAEHARICKSAQEFGLVLPGPIIVDRPGLQIRQLRD